MRCMFEPSLTRRASSIIGSRIECTPTRSMWAEFNTAATANPKGNECAEAKACAGGDASIQSPREVHPSTALLLMRPRRSLLVEFLPLSNAPRDETWQRRELGHLKVGDPLTSCLSRCGIEHIRIARERRHSPRPEELSETCLELKVERGDALA